MNHVERLIQRVIPNILNLLGQKQSAVHMRFGYYFVHYGVKFRISHGEGSTLIENYGLVPVEQNAVFQVPAYRSGKHQPLQVPALLHQVRKLVAVGNAAHVLLDDGPVVQNLSDVVAGGANQLYASLVRGVIGARPGKRGQKRVMHVDDPPRIAIDEPGRKNLHVAGQHHQVDSMLIEQVKLLRLNTLPGLRVHGKEIKRHLVKIRQTASFLVIADNQGNLAVQLTRLMPVQQVGQAVQVVRNEDAHCRRPVAVGELPGHLVARGDRFKHLAKLGFFQPEPVEVKFHPHEEQSEHVVLVLVGVQDIGLFS